MTQCKFFVAGYCMRGDSCRYTHETTPGISNPASAPPAPRDVAKPNTSKRIASQFLQGGSWREQRLDTPNESSANDILSSTLRSPQPLPQIPLAVRSRRSDLTQPTQDNRSQIPCYHYARGNCRNGNTCSFSHLDKREQKVEKASDPEVPLF
jgi:hypothetical protein